MLVGSYGDNGNKGGVYAFNCPTASTCSKIGYLNASDAAAGDTFGVQLALSNNIAVIGAPGKNTNQGAAYVFTYQTPSNFSQASILNASDGAGSNGFGRGVSISGNLIVVGAYVKNSGQGAAYVFNCASPSNCPQTSILVASDGSQDNYFGYSVAISGSTVVIGAYGYNDQGKGYLFNCSAADCFPASTLVPTDPSDGAQFGASVALLNDLVVVGANGNQGVGYIFECPTLTTCSQYSEVTGGGSNLFGSSVAVSIDVIVFGSFGNGNNAGAAYVMKSKRKSKSNNK